jgi:hypothetical protein
MRIYMQQQGADQQTLRFCHIHLQEDLIGGWNLIKETGIQGKPGRVVKTHFESHADAIEALSKLKDDHVDKGFKIVFARGETG